MQSTQPITNTASVTRNIIDEYLQSVENSPIVDELRGILVQPHLKVSVRIASPEAIVTR